ERLSARFTALLERALADPTRPVAELDLLDASERQRVLVDWSGSTRAYPRDRGIHELFEEQARRSADRVAVEFGPERLTYRELDGRANALAHRLRAAGVAAESRVGICLERSAGLRGGETGILQEGGAHG